MATKNKDVIRPHTVVEYTREQLIETEKCRKDPIYFIVNYLYVQHPIKGKVKFKLYDFQEDLIRLYVNERYVITTIARQSGKTQTSAAFLLWKACFEEDKTLLIASNHNANAMEVVSRIQFMYENLPIWLKPGVVEYNKHNLKFDNGCEIISQATTEKTGRGLSISTVLFDEVAFVNPSIQRAMWASISPTLATGGQCIMTSTPNGDTDLFAELFRGAEAGVNGFKSFRVDWSQVPGRDEKFKDSEIGKIGEILWRQEYECAFLSSDALLFDSIFIYNIRQEIGIKDLSKPNAIGFHIWEQIRDNAPYLICMDPATGTRQDFTVINVFSYPELTQVMQFRSNETDINKVYKIIKLVLTHMEKKQCDVYFGFERNAIGEGMNALINNDEDLPVNVTMMTDSNEGGRHGFYTTDDKKAQACITLKSLIERRQLKIRSRILIDEMGNFIRSGKSYKAKIGSTDDCISSLLVLVHMLTQMAKYEDRAYELMYRSAIGDAADVDTQLLFGMDSNETYAFPVLMETDPFGNGGREFDNSASMFV